MKFQNLQELNVFKKMNEINLCFLIKARNTIEIFFF